MKSIKFAAAFLIAAGTAFAEPIVKQSLSLDDARQLIQAARDEAGRRNAGGAIAVVDDGGNLIALERIDGTFVAAARVSIGKARTSAAFQKPTSFFENVIRSGRTPMVALEDFTPLQGGIPIILNGQLIGAIGYSGAHSAQEDEEIVTTAADKVFNQPTTQPVSRSR